MAKKKNYFPKRIAGLKVPKAIRRGVLGEFLSSAAGQALVAALIMKLAQRVKHDVMEPALNAGHTAPRPGNAGPEPRSGPALDGAREWAEASRDPTLNVRHALAEGARHFLLGLSHPKPLQQRRAAAGSAPTTSGERGNGSSDRSEGHPAKDETAAYPH